MEQKYDVFISYSRKDYIDENKNEIPNNAVSKIKKALTNEEISFWFDEDGIYSGQNFVEKIVTNIEASKIFVYLSTVNSNNSKWTCKEIASADEFGKPIIPVRIDSSPYNKKVLFRIADLDYIEYYSNPQKGIEELITSIKAHLRLIQEEIDKKKEEEEKRLEAKRKKEEEEKKKKELEEKERKEELLRICSSIKVACEKLNNEEVRIEIDRKNLLLNTERITDSEQKESLRSFIINSSPIRQKNIEENNRLQEEITQLNNRCKEVVSENDKLSNQLKQYASEKLALEKEVSIIKSKNKRADKQKTNIVQNNCNKKNLYITIISVIIALLVGFISGWISPRYSKKETLQYEKPSSSPIVNVDNKPEKTTNNIVPKHIRDSVNNIIESLSSVNPILDKHVDGFNKNDLEAIYKLGKCFEKGDFLEGNRNSYLAGQLIHIAADQGFAEAQNTLGFYFFHGRTGYVLDYDSSTYWFSKAIENGSLDAQYNLALAYDDGRYTGNQQSELRTKEAFDLYMESSKKGYAKSQVMLGLYYYNNKNYVESKKWFETALSGTLPSYEESKAQFMMGQLYGTGKPGVTHDDSTAFSWYQKSASNGEGYIEAQFYLGRCYEKGRGTSIDLVKAKEWYKKAADRGHQNAKKCLKALK